MSNILEVKNLKVSFRTSGGTVKAVRDISFNLQRGRTLAIVGESGSGKSVTSKAIMGILAGNAIVEGGEILYDGKDLLKLPEEDMCRLRGDKIAMIFQDPLSSLNPIVKTGRQITEAMLLKNKTSRKTARNEFNRRLKLLEQEMAAVSGDARKAQEMCKTFDNFCIEANKLENRYHQSFSVAVAVRDTADDLRFRLSKKQRVELRSALSGLVKQVKRIQDPFITAHLGDRLNGLCDQLTKAGHHCPRSTESLTDEIDQLFGDVISVMTAVTEQEKPNFFRIGYYSLKQPDAKITEMEIAHLNEIALDYMNEHFMLDFIALEEQAIRRSCETSLEKKKALLPILEEADAYFAKPLNQQEAGKKARELSALVEGSIDPLALNKDSMAYTFRSAMEDSISKYFLYTKKNPREEKRFEQQSKKREALISKGRTVTWKVVPKATRDLEELQADIVKLAADLREHYQAEIAAADSIDFHARGIEMIDSFKELASRVVAVITSAMAKEKAIKLMEEVGISEPHRRFNQYPFEFSGGMRQRIVIAIALAADPEILICDEPTTALDVTIQAQILELINQLKAERHLSVIFITHDLGVVANMADDIAVMYAGKIIEYGTDDDIFYDPRHPYTWALLSSMPDLDTKERLDAIPGTPPNMIYPPEGDAFAPRNKYAMAIDFEAQPPMFPVSPTHQAATWLLHPDAPEVEIPAIIRNRIARMKKAEEEQYG